MLCDPFKYQDYVNKFLDGIEEEEELKTQGGYIAVRKRTRSSTYLSRPPAQQLHDIHEEEEHHLEH
jgi:hypothetical protein